MARDWLASEILGHLTARAINICIVEDICSSPSDPGLDTGAAGPAWFYKNRVLWPITQDMARPETIDKALGWGVVGWPEIIAFCTAPPLIPDLGTGSELPEASLQHLAESTIRLVTDIFDGEAFLVWDKGTAGPGSLVTT